MNKDIIDIIKIPHDRIAVLIGPKGTVRKRIEKESEVKITVDSESGEVTVLRPLDAKDPLKTIKSLEVIKAVARGFSPQKAYKLFMPNYYLEIIDLTEHVSDKHLERVRARIIGRQGKARSFMSRMTSTEIVIYGKTVSIIGDEEDVNTAKESILSIIKGTTHKTVFQFLERNRRKQRIMLK